MLHKTGVVKGVNSLLKQSGNIWVKLDAGSEEYYQKVNISRISHKQIVDNIEKISSRHPITIQTLFFKLNGAGPSKVEIEKYTGILSRLVDGGAHIDEVQLHSISRKPAQDACQPLEKEELVTIATSISDLCDVTVNVY